MKIFIWKRIEHLTENYHESGGAVVIASSSEEAVAMLPESARNDAPDYIFEVEAPEPLVVIFPNAGCC